MYKKIISASTKTLSSSVTAQQSSLNTNTSSLVISTTLTQKRYKKSSKDQKSKDAKWMRQAGVFRYKKPKYQLQKMNIDNFPVYNTSFAATDELRETYQWLGTLYNDEKLIKEGITELKPLSENSFAKFAKSHTFEEVANMTAGDIEKQLDNPSWDAFEFHLSLDADQQDDLAFNLSNTLLPSLIATPRETLLPHVSDMEPDFTNDFSKLPKNPADRKVVEGRLVTNEYLKQIHERFGQEGDSPEDTFSTLCLYEEALSYEQSEYNHEKELAEKVREQDFVLKHVSKADLGRMFELHKKDPAYWTGEKLALEFGITREQAWSSLILQEWQEAEETGKPFRYDKAKIVFNDEIRKATKREKEESMPNEVTKILTKQITEEEAYRRFLEESSKPIETASDDNLPDYIKYPFQEPVVGEQEQKQVKIIDKEVENNTGFGSDVARYKLYVAEMKKKFENESDRRFMVSEEDGSLRTMSQSELAFMHRHGTFPKTREGLGGKEKRKNERRKRRF
ncbi:hypothetical protein NAEGRDRAFT_79168 [Naegleria gruberi]|uniref:Uncharacterized protein n=1 Tax=Naegleria gruberi TaxID=5762 RepID=D2VA30_NAEGR|nr:uncharacterized protein NAEGRDRAFT_79168 [Naegleria gruberi]EFC46236.1 hypothetical protein NAEGRDRAFT_79168 [Naegleria gruberi]|eukprot:XP_002678980.1 hypothetical protein NAEGRDRAFT_79168 [Naegleria gruberi strain NEG-M]